MLNSFITPWEGLCILCCFKWVLFWPRGMILLCISWYDKYMMLHITGFDCIFKSCSFLCYFENVEVKHEVVSLFTLKAYWRGGGMAPVILNFNTRWRWVASLTLQPLYPWYLLSRSLVQLHNKLWSHCTKFKSLIRWGIKLQFHVHPVQTAECKHQHMLYA